MSDDVEVPLPPAICSFTVTAPLATSGTLTGTTVFGGGSAPSGTPATTRFASVVPAAELVAIAPSQVLDDRAVTTSAVTRPPSTFNWCTVDVLAASAVPGDVVPCVSTAMAPVVSNPTTFRPATAAAAVPPSGASTTDGNSVTVTRSDAADTPNASPPTVDCAEAGGGAPSTQAMPTSIPTIGTRRGAGTAVGMRSSESRRVMGGAYHAPHPRECRLDGRTLDENSGDRCTQKGRSTSRVDRPLAASGASDVYSNGTHCWQSAQIESGPHPCCGSSQTSPGSMFRLPQIETGTSMHCWQSPQS